MIPQNNASSTLAAAITSTGATTFTVATGEGSKFGTGPLPIWVSGVEAMLMSSRSGDVLTVTRAQQGTTAVTHLISATVKAEVDKALLEGLRDEALASANAYTDTLIAGVGGGANGVTTTFGSPITTGITLSGSDLNKWFVCTGTSANYTVVLPPISGNSGKWIGFIMGEPTALTKLVTLDGNASETINSAATRIMRAQEVALLYIDSSGYRKVAGVSKPFSCGLYRSAALNIADSTFTLVAFDTTGFTVGSMSGPSAGLMTIQRPGCYEWRASVPISSALAAASFAISSLFRNGSPLGGRDYSPWSAGWYPEFISNGRADDFAAGDTVGLFCYHNSGQNAAVVTSSSFDDVGARFSLMEIPSW